MEIGKESDFMEEKETRTLPCGCIIGKTKKGAWFYQHLCEIHIPEILKNGEYSYEKEVELTRKLNAEINEEKNSGYGIDVMIVKKDGKNEESRDKDKRIRE